MTQQTSDAPAAGQIVVLVRDFGTAWVQRLAETVRATGAQVGLVTADDVPALTDHVDAVSIVDDPTDPQVVAAAAGQLAGDRHLSAVLSITDGCVAVAAQAAELLGLRHTPAAPIVTARNKFALREALQAAGLPGPGHALVTDPSQAAEVAARVGLPAVVKPVSGTGSHLVRLVHTVEELADAYRAMVERMPVGQLRYLYRGWLDGGAYGLVDPARTALVEGALSGREFSQDLIIRHGVLETLPLVDKFLVDDRFFELGFVTPPFDLSPEREQAIRTAVTDAVHALGLDNTVAHVEVIDDEVRGPTIVEVNAGRPGGQASMRLNLLTGGVDMVTELAAVHRGLDVARTPPQLPIPLASLNIFTTAAGRVRAIRGLDTVADHPDVVAVTPEAAVGDVLSVDHEERVATVVVAGFLDRDDLVKTYYELADAIEVDVDPV